MAEDFSSSVWAIPTVTLVVIEAQEGLDFRAKFFLLLISKVTVFLASEKQL